MTIINTPLCDLGRSVSAIASLSSRENPKKKIVRITVVLDDHLWLSNRKLRQKFSGTLGQKLSAGSSDMTTRHRVIYHVSAQEEQDDLES